jgi:phosphoserine phosphatase RsbU/P
VSLDRLGTAVLRRIVEPFDGLAELAISVEDLDGRVMASSGSPNETGPVEVARAIEPAGVPIGRVVGHGPHGSDGALALAVVYSVAASIGALAETLADRQLTDAAVERRLRLEAELALGRRIQRSLIPLVSPSIPGYAIASHYEAAQEVGGDFFDVFRVRGRNGRLALCVADVTGKGIPAALLMAFARPLLHAAIDNATEPVEALERTNRILVEERRSSLFITALCGVVDLRRGIVRLANAGHEPPLFVPANGGAIASIEGSGPLLGAFHRLDLVERSVVMTPGDLLLLYTDGVTDARAADGRRFGYDRLIEVLDSTRGAPPATIVEAICAACHRFQAGEAMADDITILAIRREGRRPGGRRCAA